MANICIIQGPDKGQTVEIPPSGCIIGRGADTIQLHDTTISRSHARIMPQNDRYYIQDMESANGTYVNGARIGKYLQLKHGDRIRVGKTLLVFSEDQTFELPLDETEYGDLIDIDEQGNLVDSSIMAAIPSDRESLMAPVEPKQANQHLRVLYDMVSTIGSIFNVEQLLYQVMELIFRELPVDRGFMLLRNETTGKFEPVVVKYRTEKPGRITTSNTIIKHILSKREGVLCTNAMTDKRFNKGDSVQGYGLRSVICVPIIARDKILGIIHIDSSISNTSYTQEQLHLISAIGYQTGLAVQNVQLYLESVRVERLAATGQTVAAMSHYIKNILQGLQGGADTVELGLRSNNLKIAETGWIIVNRNLDKIQHLMLNMLAFSKERKPRLELMQINSIVNDVLDLTRKRADDRGVMLITDLGDRMPAIPVDQDGIHQVILNIVNNAIEAVPANAGAVTLRTDFNESTQEAVITIGDNGPGISEEEVEKIFELFHSTKGHGGTGLGLAVAKKIVAEHNGDLDVVSHSGEGTLFTVRIPAEQPKTKNITKIPGVEDTQ
ncbi:MAG: FHA domain-containing protein [Phycisphaerae bacterium]|nr:FHA domain-containing protein [Phycisphaerae bacterium]